jgi:hypothetical protein
MYILRFFAQVRCGNQNNESFWTPMNVQALCDKLVANVATLTELHISTSAAELKLILDAAKKNRTVKKVRFANILSVPTTLSLACVLSEHPEIQEIEFYCKTLKEFGPIALAIQRNHKLTRLQLYACRLTPNFVECIRWLFNENALESLILQGCRNGDGEPPFDISGVLLGNSSLKELVLRGYNVVFGSETYQAIPHMIRANQGFEILKLALWKSMTDPYELVMLIAQAAEGHASLNTLVFSCSGANETVTRVGIAVAIGTMLQNAPALRELSLTACCMGSAGARHLADGLSSKNSVVEKLDLSSCNLGTEGAIIFARLLVANQKLKSLMMRQSHIGDYGALELAVAMRQNNTLELFDLSSNNIGSNGASALADALVANTALNHLDLRHNTIGDDGATSIAEMLTKNESIEKIYIGGFGEEGLRAFVTCLSQMTSVKTFTFSWYVAIFTSEIRNILVKALELNTALEMFDFETMGFDREATSQVTRLLALNRGGRRLLSMTGKRVPPLNYWPRIVARSSTTDRKRNADVVFYFLREIPNVLVSRAGGSRERT